MSTKKKPLRKGLPGRLQNSRAWLKHPVLAAGVFLVTTLFAAMLFLSLPCGKRGAGPVDGFCGVAPIISGLQIAIIAVSFGIICALYLTMQEAPPDKATLRKIFSRSKRPKWWRRWYPAAFACSYLLAAAVFFWLDAGAGLRWYHYTAQYALFAPLASWLLASGLMAALGTLRKGIILR